MGIQLLTAAALVPTNNDIIVQLSLLTKTNLKASGLLVILFIIKEDSHFEQTYIHAYLNILSMIYPLVGLT